MIIRLSSSIICKNCNKSSNRNDIISVLPLQIEDNCNTLCDCFNKFQDEVKLEKCICSDCKKEKTEKYIFIELPNILIIQISFLIYNLYIITLI